jgi:hypothetical protein
MPLILHLPRFYLWYRYLNVAEIEKYERSNYFVLDRDIHMLDRGMDRWSDLKPDIKYLPTDLVY